MTIPYRATSRTAAVAAAVASAVSYPFLPDRVATHFDAEGRPDSFSSRTSAAIRFPVMMLGIQMLNDRLGWWPGGRDRDEGDSGVRARDEAIALTEMVLLPTHLAILARGLGVRVDMSRVERVLFAVLMIALGNVLPTLPRNGLIGIRTPWTLADPVVWERTHRVGGYLVTTAGLVSLASLPAGTRAARVPMAATVSAVGLSVVYSFVAYARRAHFSR